MDNENPTAKTSPSLPKNSPFASSPDTMSPSSPTLASSAPAGTALPAMTPVPTGENGNGVFRHLVKDDSDIAGLVAYSIYKQNKLDWLTAFEKARGRPPEEPELASYIIGEGTPRRLATYRHLAEATLAGHGPDVDGGTGGQPYRRRPGALDKSVLTTGLIATYALVAVLFVIGFWLAAHFTMASR